MERVNKLNVELGGLEAGEPGKPGVRFFLFVLLVCIFSDCVLAQEDKTAASVFLPGVVSTESNDFNACFSKDKKSFYFSRTVGKKTQLFVTNRLGDKWSRAERLSFCDVNFAYADPAFSPDGELYFISTKPTSVADTLYDYDIWKTSFDGSHWKEPVNVIALNSPKEEYYISFNRNGDAYFSSSREGGFGEEDIYVAKFVNADYSTPVNLGSRVNSVHSEYDPFISESENILFFVSSGRKDSFGKADLYWVEKSENWGDVNHFGSAINSPHRDYCPFLSVDGEFFFSSNGEVRKITGLEFRRLLNVFNK